MLQQRDFPFSVTSLYPSPSLLLKLSIYPCTYTETVPYSQIRCIGVNVNHNATPSSSLAPKNKTENDSRLLKNSEGNLDNEWYFCRGQEADIALFFQETRMRKIRNIFEENWSTIARNRAITSNET